jgi:hypothetical protein
LLRLAGKWTFEYSSYSSRSERLSHNRGSRSYDGHWPQLVTQVVHS